MLVDHLSLYLSTGFYSSPLVSFSFLAHTHTHSPPSSFLLSTIFQNSIPSQSAARLNMLRALISVSLCATAAATTPGAASDLISSLPGIDVTTLPFKMYSGYVSLWSLLVFPRATHTLRDTTGAPHSARLGVRVDCVPRQLAHALLGSSRFPSRYVHSSHPITISPHS